MKHLKSLPQTNAQIEAYTLASISENIKIDSSKVSTALSELESEDAINSRKVQINVFVPKNEEGSRILSSFASKEFIGYSPYWASIFAFAIFIALLLAYGRFQFQTTSQTETFTDVYSAGVRNGAFLSFLISFTGGAILQIVLTKFRRWQLVSEKSYKLISDLIKHIAYVFVPLFFAVYLMLSYYSISLEPAIILGMLTVSIAFSSAYEGLKRKREHEDKSLE